MNITETTQHLAQKMWNPPNLGSLLINTNVAISPHKSRTGIRVIARDWQGKIIKVWAKGERKNGIPLDKEVLAVRWALLKE